MNLASYRQILMPVSVLKNSFLSGIMCAGRMDVSQIACTLGGGTQEPSVPVQQYPDASGHWGKQGPLHSEKYLRLQI